jgi:hypothetical protein
VTTDVLIPALEDAHDSHAALVDRFRSDLAVTPAGPHRQALASHLADTADYTVLLDTHIRDIRPRSPLRDTTETVRNIAEGAVRTTTLPLKVGALIAGRLLHGRRPADERELLKNAEDEYTITARALAVCRAAESIATQADDGEGATLLASLRRQDQEILEALEDAVAEHARAMATANGDRPAQIDGGLTGTATRMAHSAVDRLRDAVRASQQAARPDADAADEIPGATRMAQEPQGVGTLPADLPITGFDMLPATDLIQRLRMLSQDELTVVEGYEHLHAKRPGVLDAIEHLRGNQPWPDYDALSPDQIQARLRNAAPAVAGQVQDYEQRHRQRAPVITAAKQRISA